MSKRSRTGEMVMQLAALALWTSMLARASAASSTFTTLDVLVAFRNAITADPTGALSSWSTNQSDANYCAWEGVVCRLGTHQVKGIQLGGRKLQGSITPLLGKLSSLSYLNLSLNHLSGILPVELAECTSLAELTINDNQLISGSLPQEFANLTRLRVLSAGGNNLSGELPALPLPLLHYLNLSTNIIQGRLTMQLAGCATLRVLDLSQNAFQGSIPTAWANLSHLAYLDLAFNTFSSSLPPSLANCTHLSHLNLYTNQLSGSIPDSWFPQFQHRLTFFSLGSNGCNGSVPSSIASLSKLEYIELGGNHFNGQILHHLLNCTRLSILDLWGNSFSESLPSNLGTALPRLTVFGVIFNRFYGNIPVSLRNCSELGELIMGFNYGIAGTIPKELFGLHKVSQLDLQYNALTGNIPAEIGNTSSVLIKLLLNNNKFTGSLPPQLGLLPALQQINFEFNQISGGIPRELSNCTHLFLITGYRNLLQGSIPSTLGYLDKLEHLILDNNQLSGKVPSSLANCTRLTNVSLNNNLLEGPLLAATLPNMLYYDVSNNRLSGSIPDQFGSMSQVALMDLSFNNLSGSIPISLASCVNLFYLNISSNRLSGSIPSQLAVSLKSLSMLNLSRNSLSGTIPTEIGSLISLQKLDLSFNSLSGNIPNALTNLSTLIFLNVSYNNLEGEVPDTGSFHAFSPASFLGNAGLCGLKLLHIACPHHSSQNMHVLFISFIVAGAVILIVVLALTCICWVSPKAKRIILSTLICSCCKRSYFDERAILKTGFLRLTLKEIHEATDNFSPANVLGEGGTGVVYKGVTRDGKALAFKKLHLPRNSPVSPFFAEVRSLGQVRHRNLVRILGYFSDLENDILILEYMPNGNLSQHLHNRAPASDEGNSSTIEVNGLECSHHHHALSWPERLQLAKGIAAGLAYLHHDCPDAIIHLDIKPTNILLDEDLEARITDFGLARVVQASTASMSTSTQNMRGSLGYMAPEYANMGKISRKCDVYSFGIVLLEMLTGKTPTDDMFIQGRTLAKWVLSSKTDDGEFHEQLVELCMGDSLDNATQQRKQVNLLLDVAMSCTNEDPKERPTMQKVMEIFGSTDAEAGALSMSQKAYLRSLVS